MAEAAGVLLETERLRLRRFTADDVDLLVDLDSDPEVMRFVTGGRTTPREEIVTDYLPAFLGYYDRYDGFGFWAAEERTSDRFIGWFHLRPPDAADPLNVELGYRLRRDAWGGGYAVEGSRALVDLAFREARCAPGQRRDRGRARRVAPGDGTGRAALRPDVLPGLALRPTR